MNGQATTAQNDALLTPFLSAPNEAAAEQSLTRLLSEYADPVIRGVISRKLHLWRSKGQAGPGGDAEDVPGEVLIKLLGRLRELRGDPGANPIGNFQSYVAVVTYNVCHSYLRKKYPRRHLLKNRARYLMGTWSEFAVWEGDGPE